MHSLSKLHSFGLQSQCLKFLEITDLSQLKEIREHVFETPHYFLGEGSNTVFVEDFEGTVVRINLKGKDLQERNLDVLLSVQAGENWHQLVAWCLERDIFGFENLALIPGSVGAAPIQNIGAYGVEIERFIESVSYIDLTDGQIKLVTREDCRFAYRDSIFKHELFGKCIIVQVTFCLPKCWEPAQSYNELRELVDPSPRQIFDKVVQIRRAKLPDPVKMGNAGSFFKNPVIGQVHWADLKSQFPDCPGYKIDEESTKIPAAWLIDRLGFKGKKIGGVGCHPTQALVLTNDGTGTGEDLMSMARSIKSAVKNEFEISLENEVRLIGKKGMIGL